MQMQMQMQAQVWVWVWPLTARERQPLGEAGSELRLPESQRPDPGQERVTTLPKRRREHAPNPRSLPPPHECVTQA